CARASQGFDYW
nr:immunoglobulin heavy chain junction region [Macaca mulatta]MOX01421.1 immunoglobulin heavy chain junction region [Macaca mulatta]MOX03309.1 immunoglobulin heavy chain junction region [Macaca mulatta]MOX04789.1 immunoglobulin heavy chain junction region [Macaca mulatta]MOX04968.1 immunoglobulin heavy chain junction region [Macaca mulatta]